MNQQKQPNFSTSNGFLIGPTGRWRLSDIKATYKREGGRMDPKKWLASLAGMTAGIAAMAFNPVGGALVAAGGYAYFSHRTMRVYALIDGHEVELLAEPYIGSSLF